MMLPLLLLLLLPLLLSTQLMLALQLTELLLLQPLQVITTPQYLNLSLVQLQLLLHLGIDPASKQLHPQTRPWHLKVLFQPDLKASSSLVAPVASLHRVIPILSAVF